MNTLVYPVLRRNFIAIAEPHERTQRVDEHSPTFHHRGHLASEGDLSKSPQHIFGNHHQTLFF